MFSVMYMEKNQGRSLPSGNFEAFEKLEGETFNVVARAERVWKLKPVSYQGRQGIAHIPPHSPQGWESTKQRSTEMSEYVRKTVAVPLGKPKSERSPGEWGKPASTAELTAISAFCEAKSANSRKAISVVSNPGIHRMIFDNYRSRRKTVDFASPRSQRTMKWMSDVREAPRNVSPEPKNRGRNCSQLT